MLINYKNVMTESILIIVDYIIQLKMLLRIQKKTK